MAADTRRPSRSRSIGAVVPIDQAASVLGFQPTADKRRHDNPHWPVRSPAAAAAALHLHGGCPWHCSTRIAALIVSADDYQYFRDRGVID
ncbi:hypothetical protein IU449_12010 [Nocardia higoensis]|uniref:Uncharacterized protein n=1 Tax=Nocardia higoensis TaxID=228599 RepID=A0ABS0DEZ3_9NOCA|nr:hypothetical protein [Nocardia higoensis]MBF6355258.1 hypothetical protein [Nocardia higoensis]